LLKVEPMLKLTRLNQHEVAINPDHISWVDASPDTTLFLIGGEKMMVLERVDELIARVVEFRRLVRSQGAIGSALGVAEGDPPRIGAVPQRQHSSNAPSRSQYPSNAPRRSR